MPPTFALLGCLAFVAWSFRQEARRPSPTTGALWVPVLWIMRCASRGVDYWLGGGDDGRLDPVFLALLIAAGILVLARRRCLWRGIIAHNAPIFVFYGYIALSLFWADSLEDPAIKIIRPIGDLTMALIVATEPDPGAAIAASFRRMGLLLVPLSVILVKYFPQLGRGQDKHWGPDMWIGVTTHKNPLGQLCLAAALGYLWTLAEAKRKGRPLRGERLVWIHLGLAFYLFNGGGHQDSRSSTAILCLLLAVALFLIIGKFRGRVDALKRWIAVGVAGIGALAVALSIFGTSLQSVVAESAGKDGTLSDRTYLWSDVIRIGMQEPILGAGYGAFWVPSLYPKLSPRVDNHPAEAHNGYLETFADLGLVGVGLLAVLILRSLKSAADFFEVDFDYGRIRLVLLLTIIVMNYSEATFPRGAHLWWVGFLVAAVGARPWTYWPETAERQQECGSAVEQVLT